jgi:hypothetical protein
MKSAVLLIAFNRPDTTQHVFAAIRKAKPKRLYLAIDGPRSSKSEDIIYIAKTKALISKIDWNCQVKRLYRSKNLGCKRAVSTAINWFFSFEKEGIILEDDCVPTPDFFKFCELMLEKYRDDQQIMMVSGTNYLSSASSDRSSYFFSQYYAIWGWATWKRAWKLYDVSMSDWPTVKASSVIKDNYPQKYMQSHLAEMFESVYNGKVDTWDVQWFYACLKQGGLTIVPSVNLISNIGLVGTHTTGDHTNNNIPTGPFDTLNLIDPTSITPHRSYDNKLYEVQFKPSFIRTLRTLVSHYLTSRPVSKIFLLILMGVHQLRLKFKGNVLSNVNQTSFSKSCLIVYITMPFTNKLPSLLSSHQNYFQVLEMAKVIGELGYNIDVIDYNAISPKLTKLYNLVIDLHPHDHPVYGGHLAKSALRIAYLTGSNPTFSNKAERSRINKVFERKGVRLLSRRQVHSISKTIEQYDGVLIVGNAQTKKTFNDEFNLPETFLIPNTANSQNITLTSKSASNFLYLGGVGQVHKGLDLVLESFKAVPEAKLYVCSPFESESDFAKLYRQEMYETKNIIPVGRVDIGSSEFSHLASQCGYSILPSCSEGMAGSVVTGMSFGLIPLITKECGIDSRYSIKIADPSVPSITKLIRQCLTISRTQLQELCLNVKIESGIKYSPYNYTNALRLALNNLINH